MAHFGNPHEDGTRPHRALTRQSLAILAKLKAIAGDSEWIVPGGRRGQPISENTMLFGMYRLG